LKAEVDRVEEELRLLRDRRETQSLEALVNQIKELEGDRSDIKKQLLEAEGWMASFVSELKSSSCSFRPSSRKTCKRQGLIDLFVAKVPKRQASDLSKAVVGKGDGAAATKDGGESTVRASVPSG
jgi:hypothetical protein